MLLLFRFDNGIGQNATSMQCGLCLTFEETFQGVDQINEFDKNVEETFVHAFVFVLICIHTNFDRDWCWLS